MHDNFMSISGYFDIDECISFIAQGIGWDITGRGNIAQILEWCCYSSVSCDYTGYEFDYILIRDVSESIIDAIDNQDGMISIKGLIRREKLYDLDHKKTKLMHLLVLGIGKDEHVWCKSTPTMNVEDIRATMYNEEDINSTLELFIYRDIIRKLVINGLRSGLIDSYYEHDLKQRIPKDTWVSSSADITIDSITLEIIYLLFKGVHKIKKTDYLLEKEAPVFFEQENLEKFLDTLKQPLVQNLQDTETARLSNDNESIEIKEPPLFHEFPWYKLAAAVSLSLGKDVILSSKKDVEEKIINYIEKNPQIGLSETSFGKRKVAIIAELIRFPVQGKGKAGKEELIKLIEAR